MTTPPPTEAELAAGVLDVTDEAVLRAAASLYDALDPVPTGLVDRIRFGITLDALEAEIAQLQRVGELTGTRSDDDPQTVTFTSAHLTTMVTITATSAESFRIDGWIAPGGGVEVELRRDGESRTQVADSSGRFVFTDVPGGLAKFVLRPPSDTPQAPVVTPAIEIR